MQRRDNKAVVVSFIVDVDSLESTYDFTIIANAAQLIEATLAHNEEIRTAIAARLVSLLTALEVYKHEPHLMETVLLHGEEL